MKQVKKKEVWYIVGIFITLAAGTILFFFPDLIENRYPYSYPNIQDKDMQVQSLNGQLLTNESNILSEINRVNELEEEKKLVERDAQDIKSGINEDDFTLDIPSILIDLEQNAILNDVTLDIAYNSITHVKGESNSGPDEYLEPEEGSDESSEQAEEGEEGSANNEANEDSQEGQEGQESQDDSGTQSEGSASVEVTKAEDENGEDSEEEGNNMSQDFIEDNAASIEGIDTTVIPIFIKGSYKNVRNYIKYLDKIGMIEPSSVTLTSTGKEIEGSVLLNVFHGEVGL